MSDLSVEKSEELALHFQMLKVFMQPIDWDYAELVVKKLREQVSRQQSLAVLHPSYPQKKNDLISMQAEALLKFCEGVRLLQECDELKKQIGDETSTREEFQRLFL